jgi:hypothetical protein
VRLTLESDKKPKILRVYARTGKEPYGNENNELLKKLGSRPK